MRGFITFLLAAMLVLSIASLRQKHDGTAAVSQALLLEEKYYLEMEAKSAIVRAARQGAIEGEAEFAKCSAAKSCKVGMGQAIAHGVAGRLEGLAAELREKGEWKMVLWCGRADEDGLRLLAAKEMEEKSAIACAGCEIGGCEKIVRVDLTARKIQIGARGGAGGWFEAAGIGAAKNSGEIAFEAYLPPEVKIGY